MHPKDDLCDQIQVFVIRDVSAVVVIDQSANGNRVKEQLLDLSHFNELSLAVRSEQETATARVDHDRHQAQELPHLILFLLCNFLRFLHGVLLTCNAIAFRRAAVVEGFLVVHGLRLVHHHLMVPTLRSFWGLHSSTHIRALVKHHLSII